MDILQAAAVRGAYPRSVRSLDGAGFFIGRDAEEKALFALGGGKVFDTLDGRISDGVKRCPLTNSNCAVMRGAFPFMNPVRHAGRPVTVGLGDRLGLASPGHIAAVRDRDVFPVLAQQSIRELTLTGRTYEDVLAAAAWAVFQEGYERGYGADGDHLKTAAEVSMALGFGFTMITLDCSEHIRNDAADLSDGGIEERYAALPSDARKKYDEKYMGKTFTVGAHSVTFAPDELRRIACVYHDAIAHTVGVYERCVAGRPVDFEMSIDETLTPTSPASHFFVASELTDRGVEVTSLAPRFCGEFQKGIDYRGDLAQFERELAVHSAIAVHFGYKLSVHSGSDKFSVFPYVGRLGKYHLKTAGTNWLEAVRVIAHEAPALYREMHAFALEHLGEAKKYYHIGALPERVAPLSSLSDSELPALMNEDDARQIMHITYGLLLTARRPDGAAAFRDRFFGTLDRCEAEYIRALETHIGRHLSALGM